MYGLFDVIMIFLVKFLVLFFSLDINQVMTRIQKL